MKKIFSLLLCVAVLLAMSGCGGAYSESQPPSLDQAAAEESSVRQEETEASEDSAQQEQTQLTEETEPEETVLSSVQQLPQEYTSADLVYDHTREAMEWVDAVDNANSIVFAIPQIYPFSEDAIACQTEILEQLVPIYEETLLNVELKCSVSYVTVDYQAYLFGDILSLLIYQETTFDLTYYSVYNLNVKTGQRLDNAALLEQIGLSWDSYGEVAAGVAGDTFEERYGQIKALEEAFYMEQQAKTVSQENLSAAQLYLTDDGTLMMAIRIYSLAGADSYPTLLVLPIVCEYPAG